MIWPIKTVDELPFEISETSDGTLMIGAAAVSESHGWMTVIDRTSHRGSMRPLRVRVRVRLSGGVDEGSFLYVEDVDCEGRRFASLQAAVPTIGQAAVAMIPRLVFAKMVHVAAVTNEERSSMAVVRNDVEGEAA